MLTELKPCPFCGGPAYLVQPGTNSQPCVVECGNCGALHESGDEGVKCGTSWNRRVASAAPAEGREPSEALKLLALVRTSVNRNLAEKIDNLLARASEAAVGAPSDDELRKLVREIRNAETTEGQSLTTPDAIKDSIPKVSQDDGLAYEIWAAAQTPPGDCIRDAAARIQALLDAACKR